MHFKPIHILSLLLLIAACKDADKSGQKFSNAKAPEYQPQTNPANQAKNDGAVTGTPLQIGKRIRCIIQDKAGNLWFATSGKGVCRYDGKSFTYFTKKEGLTSNYVSTILEDKAGILWFGTENGVSRYDGKLFTPITDKEGLCNLQVTSALEDKNGNLWFGHDAGVCRYDGKSFKHFSVAPEDKNRHLPGNYSVYCMLEDIAGNIWFGVPQKGLCRYDGKAFTYFTEKGLNRVVRSIFQDKRGILWFGMNGGGVCLYDGTAFTNFSEEKGLSHDLTISKLEDKTQQLDRIWTIAEDLSGNIWFGTVDEGVWRYDGVSMTNFTAINGLSSNTIWSIFVDKSGNIWFGTEDGGVCKYDGYVFENITSLIESKTTPTAPIPIYGAVPDPLIDAR